MTQNVTLIDYGIGNFLNVVRALTAAGANVHVVDKASEAPSVSERMVLPGVGAFAGGMAEMKDRGLDDVVLDFVRTQRPFLGICVGMQMLFDASEEFGEHAGLGLIPGRVKAVSSTQLDGRPHCIPHIGWAGLEPHSGGANWEEGLLATTPIATPVYLVHSFHAQPTNERDILANVNYNGRRICAAVQSGHLMGTQFHPERSASAGLNMLRAFLAL